MIGHRYYRRDLHSCGTFQYNGKTMVIASGGTGSEGYLSSTEIWDPMSEDGWILGNKLNRVAVRH